MKANEISKGIQIEKEAQIKFEFISGSRSSV
jgi:hypothetical protein